MTEAEMSELTRQEIFRRMNAECGIEMTPEEANANYAACMIGLVMRDEGYTIEDAVDAVINFDEKIHPGVIKKFLQEASALESKDV